MQYDVVAGKITIGSVEAFLRELDAMRSQGNTTIQAVDATKVAGRRHVDCAIPQRHAVVSRSSKHRHGPGVEILLHLGACRQIRKALEMGVHEEGWTCC